uniref:Uncharacterized protein n=1 Tax=Glossina brevipalpis TaxID=37001 RepID=A0A1A9WST5_9MUSC
MGRVHMAHTTLCSVLYKLANAAAYLFACKWQVLVVPFSMPAMAIQPASQSASQSASQPVNQPASQSVSQSASPSVSQSASQLTSKPTNQPANQPIIPALPPSNHHHHIVIIIVSYHKEQKQQHHAQPHRHRHRHHHHHHLRVSSDSLRFWDFKNQQTDTDSLLQLIQNDANIEQKLHKQQQQQYKP